MRHVISALVMNEPGVLAHVAGMFSARGFNIDSLVVGRTEDPSLSRMTIIVNADERILEQVRKQLAKIVTVVRVRDYKDLPFVERDLALIKVSTPAGKRSEVLELVNIFRGRVVDVGASTLMVEISGEEEKIDAFVEQLRAYGIKELARTGVIAMPRGGSTVSAPDDDGPARREGIARPPRGGSMDKREPTQEELEATPPG
ncbi:MAG TPA: acetolactate synthase small subunit [Phycisphaerae bacterium]|nr:acetolactate synthase small subunit [Phycisphaerae bacterium]